MSHIFVCPHLLFVEMVDMVVLGQQGGHGRQMFGSNATKTPTEEPEFGHIAHRNSSF